MRKPVVCDRKTADLHAENRWFTSEKRLLYNQDAHFVEQPDGEGDDEEGEDVGGRRDDGGQDEDGHDGVATVLAHHLGVDDAYAPQQPAEDGQLEQDAHHEAHADEGVDVGLHGQHIADVGADLIGAEETDGQREYEVVVQEQAGDEHHVGGADEPEGVTAFAGVEAGRDEAEQLVDDVRGGYQQAGEHSGAHVDHELLGESGVDELDGKGRHAQQAVGYEAGVFRCQHYGKQQVLEQEGDDGGCHDDHGHPYEPRTQLVKMVPECGSR